MWKIDEERVERAGIWKLTRDSKDGYSIQDKILDKKERFIKDYEIMG